MRYVLIYNWKCPENDWFKKELVKRGNEVVIIDNPDDGEIRYKKWHRAINFLECLLMAKKAVKMQNDYIIVSMCATPGIIASIIDHKQHKIVALNLLCHSQNKPNAKQRLRDLFYRKAFKNINLYSTCNEEDNRFDYIKRFDIQEKERIIILEDAISAEEKVYTENMGVGIFSGGASARDWLTLLQCADNTPEYNYQICAREADWPQRKTPINVNADFNLPKEVFEKRLEESKLVVLPLKSDVTAGLLVLFNAINKNKLVVCTDTKTIRKFIPEKYYSILLYRMFDHNDLENKVRMLMNISETEEKEIVSDLKKHIYEKYSTDAYMEKFVSWMESGE